MPVLYAGSPVRLRTAFEDAAGAYADPTTVSVRTTSPAGVVVTVAYPTAPLVKAAVGRYSYLFTPAESGTWSYLWTGTGAVEATSAGTFVVHAAGTIVPEPTTLMAVEQEVARRCHGDFLVATVSATITSTPTLVGVDRLRSTANLGGHEGLWLLRRGLMADGSAILGFDRSDRVRLVDEYDAAAGTLQVDRAYANATAAGERVEVHLLHPEEQLRPAVLAGLRRCYFMDRRTVALVGAGTERNLSASLPWLTEPWQLARIGHSIGASASVFGVSTVPYARRFRQGGSLYLDTGALDPFPGTLFVEALRPAFTFVNGGDSGTGPTDDADELPVPLEYAAAAGHAEAWRRAKAVLQEAAQTGKAVGQAEAADEMTRQSDWVRRAVPRREEMPAPYLPDLRASGWSP